MSFSEKEQKLREDMCAIVQMMYNRQYIGGPAGNISAKIEEDRFLLTPSTPFKQLLKPEELIVIDGTGQKVGPKTEFNKHYQPTSEVPMHLEIYKARPNATGIVHTHPTYCVARTSAGKAIRPQDLCEGMLFLGEIGMAEYATPTSIELGNNVAKVAVDHECIVIPYHGVIIAGKDMWDAYSKMEVLEQVAQINCVVDQLGGQKPMSKKNISEILDLRSKMNMSLPSDQNLLK